MRQQLGGSCVCLQWGRLQQLTVMVQCHLVDLCHRHLSSQQWRPVCYCLLSLSLCLSVCLTEVNVQETLTSSEWSVFMCLINLSLFSFLTPDMTWRKSTETRLDKWRLKVAAVMVGGSHGGDCGGVSQFTHLHAVEISL